MILDIQSEDFTAGLPKRADRLTQSAQTTSHGRINVSMSLHEEIAKSRKLGNEILKVGASFLRTELDTSLNFALAALSAPDDDARRNRNRAHARRAYDTLMRLGQRLPFPPDDEKFRRLKDALQLLGEKL